MMEAFPNILASFTLLTETWKSMSLALCTPKNSPVIQITLLFREFPVGELGTEPDKSGPTRPCSGEGKYMLVAVSSWIFWRTVRFRPAMMA